MNERWLIQMKIQCKKKLFIEFIYSLIRCLDFCYPFIFQSGTSISNEEKKATVNSTCKHFLSSKFYHHDGMLTISCHLLLKMRKSRLNLSYIQMICMQYVCTSYTGITSLLFVGNFINFFFSYLSPS